MILSQIAVHEVPVARVEFERFGQGRADAPRQPAQTLRARGAPVEHAAKAESAEHPVNPGFSGEMVYPHLCEKCAEACSCVIFLCLGGLVMAFMG